MTEETNFIVYKGIVVPQSALLQRARESRYGTVPGLEEAELADPDELERQVVREELGPVLRLPEKRRHCGIRPAVDESGGVDWGAFGTVDFERRRGAVDRARCKAAALREKLKDVLILLSIVRERLPGNAKYRVLKYLRMGLIGMGDIVNDDMLALARLHARARKLREEIRMLEEASRRRQLRQQEAWLSVSD